MIGPKCLKIDGWMGSKFAQSSRPWMHEWALCDESYIFVKNLGFYDTLQLSKVCDTTDLLLENLIFCESNGFFPF